MAPSDPLICSWTLEGEPPAAGARGLQAEPRQRQRQGFPTQRREGAGADACTEPSREAQGE